MHTKYYTNATLLHWHLLVVLYRSWLKNILTVLATVIIQVKQPKSGRPHVIAALMSL